MIDCYVQVLHFRLIWQILLNKTNLKSRMSAYPCDANGILYFTRGHSYLKVAQCHVQSNVPKYSEVVLQLLD